MRLTVGTAWFRLGSLTTGACKVEEGGSTGDTTGIGLQDRVSSVIA